MSVQGVIPITEGQLRDVRGASCIPHANQTHHHVMSLGKN